MAGDPKGCRGRAKSPCLCRRTPASPKGNPCWGSDAPTTARLVGCAPRGAVLSFEAKESTKESTRHGDSRGGPPCFALFANIGVPGTAVPGSCICSGLPVANCLRQLCPLGTRSLSAQASVCGSRTVGCPEFIRGIQFRPLGRNSLTTFRGQTALRGCPRPRFASLTRREKALYCPFLKEGVRNVARNGVGQLSPALGVRSCSLFSSFKKGKAFSLRCLSPLGFPAGGVGQTQPM